MSRVTVRQEKKPILFGPKCFEVVKDKVVMAIIAPRKAGGYYWYGTDLGNTYAVEKTFEQCKQEAVKAVKDKSAKGVSLDDKGRTEDHGMQSEHTG